MLGIVPGVLPHYSEARRHVHGKPAVLFRMGTVLVVVDLCLNKQITTSIFKPLHYGTKDANGVLNCLLARVTN